ncbi:sensor histidine kinase [Desulfogranum japonicum]|uniref:sensor histidine kinase n=1 Tax=Desulfogranum japonicum TaxID=231447 RepID=UPI000418083E|nr:PAS domain-containing sensor histidine kinase [Desulfogranum japonicum]
MKQSRWISKLLPSTNEQIENSADLETSYRYFSKGLFIILLGVAMIPLIIISVLSHYQYQNLLQKNELTQLILNLEQSQNTIERFVSKLQSVIKFVAPDDRYQELLDPENLETLFSRLQREYPDFADIEVIDASGRQKSYIGPYELSNNDYTGQTWYQEVLQRGVYISNVFSGFRQVPHFVLAVSRNLPGDKGLWVLRVTIDGKTLQRYVETGAASFLSDVYLIDAEGVIQTQPRKYGHIGEKNIFASHAAATRYNISENLVDYQELLAKNTDVSVVKAPDGQELLHAAIDLQSTPWRLVLVKDLYLHGDDWLFFQLRLFGIILICVVLMVFVILNISNGITEHIRISDKRRQHFFVEAENANKLASIGRLAAGVAHEINNPLSIINQKTGLVMDYFSLTGDFEHKQDMQQALKGVQQSVDRCKAITHRLLGFARHTDVVIEELDMNLLLQEVVAFLAKEATYNQIDIVFELDESVEHIHSDRGQLQQVFLNIVNNAIDAIGSGGKIVLKTGMIQEKEIWIKVEDNGPGMSREVVRRIFDPFFTTKETGKGTGLGLSITYGILRKLGGRIAVDSEPGKGTAFEIILPIRNKLE